MCFRCRKNYHKVNECRVDRHIVKCELCKKEGHVDKVCITTLWKKSQPRPYSASASSAQNASCNPQFSYEFKKIEPVPESFDEYMISLILNGGQQRSEVDSRAKFSMMAENYFNCLDLNVLLLLNLRLSFSDHTQAISSKLKAKSLSLSVIMMNKSLISGIDITSSTIKTETEEDSDLKQIIDSRHSSAKDGEFTLVDEILFQRNRVVISASLRLEIPDELHETHLDQDETASTTLSLLSKH
ncbi:hypothetical protein JTB14_013219 [Gonioctena quinquepunctata]|nr:hypothetical protein JTB14_013219 [Gonioctena quinquepunctata]